MFGFKKSKKVNDPMAIYSEIINSQSQRPMESVHKLDAQTTKMITSVSKMLVTKR